MGDGFFELLVMDACQAILVKLVFQIHLRLVLAVITALVLGLLGVIPAILPHALGPHARMAMDALPMMDRMPA
jgi:hypothetical protein